MWSDPHPRKRDDGARLVSSLDTKTDPVRKDLQQWPTRHDTYLYRYQVQEAVHKSRTSEVFYAQDVIAGQPVCLKLMRDFEPFEREIKHRKDRMIAPNCVVEVLGWHTPKNQPLSVGSNKQEREREQYTDCNAEEHWDYVLVMAPAERTLLDAFSKEQLAGFDYDVVAATIRSILGCVKALHDVGLVHGDLKPRNILRQDDFDLQHITLASIDGSAADGADTDSQSADKWILCDLDATASVGDPIGDKAASAYAPPECQNMYDARGVRKTGEAITAATSYDVWSLGVIVFELVSGVRLFRQDLCQDELSEPADLNRLQVWHTIDDEELAPVFAKAHSKSVGENRQNQAKDLIRWCLKGDPDARPTVQQILDHPFLCETGALSESSDSVRPMMYFGFISHSQQDASGTAATLYQLMKRKGLHCWYDMRQQVLTLKGMRQGVRDSDVFIMILSSRVLDSWFCQQELLCAIEHKKRIQLIVEVDDRFNPFDLKQWETERESNAGCSDRPLQSKAKSGDGRRIEVKIEPDAKSDWQMDQIRMAGESHQNGSKILANLITEAIDHNLPRAVTFRRRDFEQDAMLRELCKRNGKELLDEEPAEITEGDIIRVLVICNEASVSKDSPPQGMGRLLEVLEDEDSIKLIQGSDVSSVNAVLLMLTPGVLVKDTPTLVNLEAALRYDRDHQTDRIVAVCDESWDFHSPEATQAPSDVRACLSSHEAIMYRPLTNGDGGDCYEHRAMMKQLLQKLRRSE